MIRVILLIVLFIKLINLSYANGIENYNDIQFNIRQYGLGYCLSHSSDTYLKKQAIQTVEKNQYRILTIHYKSIESFIDYQLLNNKLYYQDTNMPAILMQCMDIYNSDIYNNFINNKIILNINR